MLLIIDTAGIVFPIDGLPASNISSEFCHPSVRSSRDLNPDEMPVILHFFVSSFITCLPYSLQKSPKRTKSSLYFIFEEDSLFTTVCSI